MRVQVNEIISEDSNNFVLFSTDFGDAKAFWEGEEPVARREYQVEVDVNDTLIWHKDVLKDDNRNYSIELKNNLILISGNLESIDDDGYAVLRIGDSIVPFIAIGEPFQVDSFIKLSIKSISLSPISY